MEPGTTKKHMLQLIRNTPTDNEETQDLLAERGLHEKTLRRQIKLDKAKYIEELAEEAQQCFTTHQHKKAPI